MTDALRTETALSLKQESADVLYHLTDRENLESIIKEGGLSSWRRSKETGIVIPSPGGDGVSHMLDRRRSRDSFVHLYAKEPGQETIRDFMNTGRHSEPFMLKISTDVLFAEGVTYTHGDPYDVAHKSYDSLRTVLDSHGKLDGISVDIPKFIPWKFICNMPSKYTTKVSRLHPTAIIFVIDHSKQMSVGTVIGEEEYDYKSDFAAKVVNDQIENLMKRCVIDGEVRRMYDIAVIGYGDRAYSAWDGELEGRGFLSPAEILLHQGDADSEFRWVQPRDDGASSRCDLGLAKAGEMLKEWMAAQESDYYYPPTVIHISNGGIPSNIRKDFVMQAEILKKMHTVDGDVLLWNIHISARQQTEMLLPAGDRLNGLDPEALILYDTASIVPESLSQKVMRVFDGDDRLPRRAICENACLKSLAQVFRCCILPD